MNDVIKNIGHLSFRLPDELSGLDGKNRAVMLDDVVSILEEYQRKQPKTDWIPCEERLPNNAGMYLATYVYEGAKIVEIMFFDGKNYYYPDDMLGISKKIIEVIAWMPLPQPYKKEGAENGMDISTTYSRPNKWDR